ncbi:MAG: molecular chaperone DnaJ [bacterium]|nr:molecular chaperone DnaJ [bacterium]
MADYYEILGVDKNATKDEIKSAFRKMARQWHPDINKAPEAEAKFKELGKAYETLMDDDKRATYDRFGEDGLQNAGFNTQGPFANGFGDLEEIFNSFFGGGFGFGGSRNRDPNAPERGDDLRLDIEIEFEEAAFGITREVKIDHLEICESCKGSGAKEGTKPQPCPHCNGRGSIQQTTRTVLGQFTQIVACPHCHGKGTIITEPCQVCKGHGKKEVEKKLEVKIPAGVDTGSKMRLSHEGDAGNNGGVSGDLYIVIHVKPSKYYKRDGINVYTKLEISPAQAVLGDTVSVKTLDGDKDITIPAGIQTGEVVKIKNAGIPNLSRPSMRGEHIVVVTVKTPSHISNEEKALYQKLYNIQLERQSKSSVKERIKEVFK